MMSLNDHLRAHYSTTGTLGIHMFAEEKVSWLDYFCGQKNEDDKRRVRGAPHRN